MLQQIKHVVVLVGRLLCCASCGRRRHHQRPQTCGHYLDRPPPRSKRRLVVVVVVIVVIVSCRRRVCVDAALGALVAASRSRIRRFFRLSMLRKSDRRLSLHVALRPLEPCANLVELRQLPA